MSKLDELIQQLCPDGVEYKHLGDICAIKGRIGFRGYTRNDQVEEGEGALSLSPTNIQDGRMDYTKGTYITWEKYEESPEIMTYNGDIIFCKTASVGKTALVKDLPYKATINPQLVVLKDIQCNAPFLAYVLETNTIQKKVVSLAGVGSVPNISQKSLSELEIPLPPLSVQEEIVRLLDQLTETTKKYQAKLEAELDARKKQYEEYRNQLLTFDASRTDVEWEALNDCCVVQRGIRVVKKNLMEEGTVPVFQNSIAPMGYYDKSNYPANVSYIICAGSSSGSIGFCTVPFWAADDCLCVLSKGDIDNKFIYYYLQAQHSYIKTKVRGGAMPRLSRQVVENLKFPIISLTEQVGIVNILDRMDKTHKELCKSIETEIKMRKQQYEYYRNQLLDFKKKED